MKLLALKLPAERMSSLDLFAAEAGAEKYVDKIVSLHNSAWGQFESEISSQGWLEDSNKLAVIIAIDDQGELLGTISMKKENMENQFPDLSPWASGLYVVESSRKKGVDILLINALAKVGQAMGIKNFYAFSHFIKETESYYKKLGCENNADKQHYYKDAPIILLEGRVDKVIERTDKYIKKIWRRERDSKPRNV